MTEAALPSLAAGPGRALGTTAQWLALLLPAALLTAAFGSEYLGRLVPCELCWWQRYPHIAAVALAAAGIALRAKGPARVLTALAAVAIAVSGAIGVYHAGVELGIFEGFTTCATIAQGATSEELLKSIMSAPLVRCDQVQWSFLGISMAGWNAIISLGGAALIAFLLRREARA